MHIMIVIHSLAGGGAERVAVDLAAYWLKLGHRVSLVTQKTSDTDAYQPPAGVHRFELATAGDSGAAGVALLPIFAVCIGCVVCLNGKSQTVSWA